MKKFAWSSTLVLVVSGAIAACSSESIDSGEDGVFPNSIAGEERVGASLAEELDEVQRYVPLPAGAPTELDETTGVVMGLYQQDGKAGRYKWLVRPDYQREKFEPKDLGAPAGLSVMKLSPKLDDAKTRGGDELVSVIINLKASLRTKLKPLATSKLLSFDATPEEVVDDAKYAERIRLRSEEAGASQTELKRWLTANGAADVDGFWITNAISAIVPARLLSSLVERPDVASIGENVKLKSTAATEWDGENLKATAGLNTGLYVDNGFHGGRLNTAHNTNLRVAVLDFFFNSTHPVFKTNSTTSRVVSTWNCANNPCTSGLPTPSAADSVHGSWCASAAAGDAMDGQISGLTAAEQRDRTGVAEESRIIMISTGDINATIRGLQKAVAEKADVVSESFGGGDGVCDGTNSGWQSAVYNAAQAGVLVVGSAGNDGHATSACKLTGLSEVPSQFVVGATNDPGSGAYSTVDVASYSSRGGVSVTVDGSTFSQGFTGVDAVVPGRWRFGAGKGTAFNDVSGTSLAAPQVAGAAMLFKDWLYAKGFGGAAETPGFMYANLLAMTDRANSGTTYKSTGFDPVWGGGRLQARYYDLPAESTSGVWRWESAWYTLSDGQTVNHLAAGAGIEPAGIGQFKAYAVFLERDGTDVADIDMEVRDQNCAAGSALLGSDSSRDMKSMVRLAGSSVSNKSVCVKLKGYHVPQGESRLVQLVIYWSDRTAMR
jgi:hypothetical protein